MKKINQKNSLFILFFLLLQFQMFAQSERFSFDYITNNNGLTHNTVYDICQDYQGFMWFATEASLNRYDGKHIKQYNFSPIDSTSIPSYTVTRLLSTSDNHLFIGTNNGLALYNPKTDDFNKILYKGKSLGHILSIKQGIGTEILIATEEKGAFVYNYQVKKVFEIKSDEKIEILISDKENTYWGASKNTIYRFDKNGKEIDSYLVYPNIISSAISYLMLDRKGTLWIGTYENGLFNYNKKDKNLKLVDVCNKTKMYYVRTIEEGVIPGEYWIGTESGLYIINTVTDECSHYTQSFDEKNKTINDNAIYKIYRNKQNIFFAGTYFGGINIANNIHVGFNAVYPDKREDYLQGKAISTIVKAPDDNLWIATEDAGIAIFNKKNKTFKHLLFNENDPNSIPSNNIHALLMDGNVCWAGHFMGGLSKIDISTGKAKRFIQESNSSSSLNNNFVFALAFLSPDSILVGSLSGVDIFDKRTETFSRFRENEFADCFIYDIFEAPDGNIWFCTYENGIYVLDKTKRGLMTHYVAGDNSGLKSNSIISYCIDSKKQIWIGTRHAGLYKFIPQKNKFIPINSQMLINNVIYGVLQDNNDFLWISSNKGISRLNLSDSTAINFSVKHGIAGNQYNYKSYFKDDDGTLYFGSVTGLTWFNPQTIRIPNEIPSIYFTNLKIFNTSITPNDKDGILKHQIDFTKELKLKYNQNSFTLEFGCIDYLNSDIDYQYYLEGFENSWSPLSEVTQANFTNLSSGKYVLHIRAVNKMNNNIGPERTMTIRISPPFWASWIALFIYFALTIAVLFIILQNYRNRQRKKMTYAIEKIEKENLNLLYQHKMNFFTYITHEFKTPLSIIIASIEMLSKDNISKDEEDGITQTVKRSATRLLSLVNQLMDFRKIETDHAVINPTKGNIIEFFNQIIDVYRPLLNKKNIKLNMKVSYVATDIYFDFDKLEKILTNLLTNAVKHTPNGKTIEYELNVENEIVFSVKDSGNGLSDRQKEKIFEVFYSEDFSNEIVESSGIGLALTASLVKLLNGKIVVESKLGNGSKFIVKLPYSSIESELIENDSSKIKNKSPLITKKNIEPIDDEKQDDSENEYNKKNKFSIVIAEDNKDLLILLQKNFRSIYQVKCFENGQEAWNYINKKVPDLVITDIMMPVMSGTELCHKIKTDINLSHIPVIMLTAKTTKEAKLEGLQMGADAYIYKPFSIEELEVRVSNILNAKKVLKEKLFDLAKVEGINIPTTNNDQAFIETIISFIQENIDNSKLDVQFLADTLQISRSNLHTKIKNLMDMSTSDFINTVRINKAKEMIINTDYTLSEISYKVGYSDATYFTRVFKKIAGLSPKEFRNNIKKRVSHT